MWLPLFTIIRPWITKVYVEVHLSLSSLDLDKLFRMTVFEHKNKKNSKVRSHSFPDKGIKTSSSL